jgi:hypothetical protein
MACQKSFVSKYKASDTKFGTFSIALYFFSKVVKLNFYNFKKTRYTYYIRPVANL